ncbi:MAG: cobalamin biosynthesis protein CobW [Clostridiales Family XIII bacterium]|jgi:G3E family GTPase|nr:cobalamin biosynthesis protein CobW [Clostridiales Family XIII bacterium]
MTDIYIISGFLGAGKTTLIQKLLKETASRGGKTVVLENDFGDVGIDAALLRTTGTEVAEISAGCICCTLSGDLIRTLKTLIARFEPGRLIIEPSGVGKLSDIAAACEDEGLLAVARLRHKFTVVDAVRCRSYLDNFGEFFADQIENADTILLSRAEAQGDAENARALIAELNGRATVICEPWARVNAEALLAGAPGRDDRRAGDHCHEEHCYEDHCHGELCADEHCHDEHCAGEHGHSAEDVFDTVTIRTEHVFSPDDLKARVLRMEQGGEGTVLRAKGILRGTGGCLNLQYLPGDARIESCASGGDGDGALCVIGRDLNGRGLADLFGGVL